MVTAFIIFAMVFFLYVQVSIVISNISRIEKLVSTVLFLLIETYYVLQLFERGTV